MNSKRHTPEQIINKLRQAEVELLNRATLTEVLVERWRRPYNTVRPHSSLGYRPPAPEARQPWAPGLAPLGPTPRAAWTGQRTTQALAPLMGAGHLRILGRAFDED